MPTLPDNVAATPLPDYEPGTKLPSAVQEIKDLERVHGPHSMHATMARDRNRASHPNGGYYGVGSFIRNAWNSGPSILGRGLANSVANLGAVPAGLAGGTVGAGLGYGVGKLLDLVGDDDDSEPGWRGRLGAILGGLAGLGIGGAVGHARNGWLKTSSSELMFIQQALQSDGSLSGGEKQSLMSAVSQLSSRDHVLLANLLRAVGGAAVGALIAKFLMKAGLGGMLLGAAAGGALGATTGSRPSTLAGTYHTDKKDAYGTAYRL
jgi:hypothetical protein